MFRLYLIVFAVVLVVMVYLAGMHAGYERAKRILNQTNIEKQTQIIKIQEKINEDSVNRATDDIRSILRKKYTIAD